MANASFVSLCYTGNMNKKLQTAVVVEVLLLVLVISFALPYTELGQTRNIGRDVDVYARLGRGCITCGHAPYYAAFVLWPLGLVPEDWLWRVWTVATILIVWRACWRLDTNPVPVLLSFAMLSQIGLGQVDAIILGGLVLAFTAKNAYLRGLGLLLTSVKPQLSLVAILVLLWHDEERLKVLTIPMLAGVISLVIWGIDWPVRWLTTQTNTPPHPWRAYLFPWGLPALLIIPFIRGRYWQLVASLWASALAIPSFASYSYIVPLTFLAPWWTIPAGFAWAIGIPFIVQPIRLSWLLAVVMLIYLVKNRNVFSHLP
jgi:hypothetical protein